MCNCPALPLAPLSGPHRLGDALPPENIGAAYPNGVTSGRIFANATLALMHQGRCPGSHCHIAIIAYLYDTLWGWRGTIDIELNL